MVKKTVFCIDKSPLFNCLTFKRGPARMIPITRARLKKDDMGRLNALEKAIIAYLIKDFDPLKEKSATFALVGGDWFLQGNGLTLPQMRELKKRFKNWKIAEKKDRFGKYLKLVPDPKKPKPA
jgi:hypothetical protein